ncbi:hypothetical protein NS226_17650 [Aureimonas ureilytica]|uniref:Protein OrfX2/OrfX3/P47 domain-containing protein n=1 Tax=Aureimonas ureilytica TaxID=401562 RepID=A0A175R4R4_9HYPH|nr:hypothetical protein NS226_17650 [Aureimonas ureilytica]
MSVLAFTHGKAGRFTFEELRLNGGVDLIKKAFVRAALEKWLSENEDVIDHVFASVSIFEGLDGQSFSYLLPSEVSYAYCERETVDDSILAVIGMVGGRQSRGLDQQVSSLALSDNFDASIVIAPFVVLDLIAKHAVPAAYPGVIADDLRLCPGNPRRIELVQARKLDAIRVNGYLTSHTLTSLAIEFIGGQILVYSQSLLNYDNKIKTYTETRARHSIVMSKTDSGDATFRFIELAPPEAHSRHEIDPSYKDETEKIGIYVSGVISVASIFTGPIGFIGLSLLSGFYYGFFKYLPELECNGLEPPPSMDFLGFNASAACAWLGGKTFRPCSIELSDALRLSGDLHEQAGIQQ